MNRNSDGILEAPRRTSKKLISSTIKPKMFTAYIAELKSGGLLVTQVALPLFAIDFCRPL